MEVRNDVLARSVRRACAESAASVAAGGTGGAGGTVVAVLGRGLNSSISQLNASTF